MQKSELQLVSDDDQLTRPLHAMMPTYCYSTKLRAEGIHIYY